MTSPAVPFLPDTAPFTPAQRAWLNGFFAGLFSGAPAGAAAAPAPALEVTLLFGTQTGTAETLAKKAAKELRKRNVQARVAALDAVEPASLARAGRLLLICSTYGEGEMPDAARGFWDKLAAADAPRLAGLEYSVLALGDSSYAQFCEAGKAFDARLEELGARRLYPRVDSDKDVDPAFAEWIAGVSAALGGNGDVSSAAASAPASATQEEEPEERFTARQPFASPGFTTRRLNTPASAKDTRHVEISLAGSGLTYEAGDALGVIPMNCPELVADVLAALGADGEEGVPDAAGATIALRKALLEVYDLRTVPRPLLEAVARGGDTALADLLRPEAKAALAEHLHGREVVDVLLEHPSTRFSPAAFVGLLRRLQHRLYSISSSPRAAADQVHLTVGVVRYQAHGRARKGVCSTYLAERAETGRPLPVFVHRNSAFRLPADPTRPVIMVGPGTGIAPFRAFLQDRRATGAPGRNWLFFGDQRAASDFLYEDELAAWRRDGHLHRLDLAFSRDQAEKVYVQSRMAEHAAELYAWLEEGAHFYVCGDASRMARDVDRALHEVVASAGGRTPEQAAAYVRDLQKAKRYVRDVY